MIGARMRPSGVWPLVSAVTICAGVHLPRPVALSGVRLGPTKTPRLGMPNPTSEPPRYRVMSGLPKKYPGVWQSLQPLVVTRYLPRAMACLSAALARSGIARQTPASTAAEDRTTIRRRPAAPVPHLALRSLRCIAFACPLIANPHSIELHL